jgi:hypothetical protein
MQVCRPIKFPPCQSVTSRPPLTFRCLAPAQGLMAQSRILGGNIGLAIATVIQNNKLGSGLRGVLSPSQIADLRQMPLRSLHLRKRSLSPVSFRARSSLRSRSALSWLESVCYFVGSYSIRILRASQRWLLRKIKSETTGYDIGLCDKHFSLVGWLVSHVDMATKGWSLGVPAFFCRCVFS